MKSTLSLFSLNELQEQGPQGNNVFIHSQLLVTDQIRDAITSEAITASLLSPRLRRFSKLRLVLKEWRHQ
jgi:hypothetical protein